MSRRRATYRFRLYTADNTENSEAARANLATICRTYLADDYEVEIVDVLKQPGRALDDGILMTPTLVKLAPLPERRIVGTLSRTAPVLLALGVEGTAA
jgi:circadian clock protein KaiB